MKTLAQGGERRKSIVAVDLFSGAGGLTEGVKKAGIYVCASVEIDPDACATYARNHPEVHQIQRDISQVSGSELLKTTPTSEIDILMGCAPCQGFCSLTVNKSKDDPRNKLILEFARLVEEVQPKIVFMENVPGIQGRGKNLLNEFTLRLKAQGYEVVAAVLQMADYGVPQSRKRFVLVASRGRRIALPLPTHSKKAVDKLLPWRTVRQVLRPSLGPPFRSDVIRDQQVTGHKWHVVRRLKAQTIARLSSALAGGSRLDLPERLLPACHHSGYDGFRNVYTRMAWDKPSPTITSGCITPAKGRFGHPDRRRTTISVREAALIQTFPADYEFVTNKIDSACQMIGNAVPPLFAEVMANHLKRQY